MAFTRLEPTSVNTSASFTFSGITSGNVTSSGNISATYYIGNGSLLTGIASGSNYSNSNVGAYLPTYSGNVSANYFIGNGSTLTHLTGGNVDGQVANANYAAYAGNVTASAQPNITSVGTLASLSVTGVTTATGGVKTANIQDVSGTVTLQTKYASVSGDVGIVGSLTVGTAGTGNVTATNFTGNLITGTQSNITTVGTLSSITTTGLLSMQQATEKVIPLTGATGTVTHDFSTGSVFFHSSMAADFTANFTNMPTTADRVIVIGLFLIQGSTPYRATAVQIDGVSQTINWPNATAPTATASRKEVQTFTFVYTGGSWYVFGNLTSFG